MNIKTHASEYGRKQASIRQLLELIENGDEQARLELQTRLPAKLANLKRFYEVAYGVDAADRILIEQVSNVKSALTYEDTLENDKWFVE